MDPRSRAAIKKTLVMLALWLTLGLEASRAAEREGTRVDRYGDPLPPGAVARLVNKDKPSSPFDIVFSPDGRLLASCFPGDADRDICLWDVKTTKEVRCLSEPSARTRTLVFAPDGKTLAACNRDNTIILWDVAAGKPIFRKRSRADFSAWGAIHSVTFSSDGKTVASLTPLGIRDLGQARTVHLWETLTGEERIPITPVDRGTVISSFAFSPREPLLAIGTAAGAIHLWSLAEERFVRRLTFDGQVNRVAFSPDGVKVFAAGYAEVGKDGRLGASLRSWDVASGKPLLGLIGEDPNKRCLAISPNGRLVAIARGNRASLWDSATGAKRVEFTARSRLGFNALAFSPDGTLLATAGKEILLWDLSSLPHVKGGDGREKPTATRPRTESEVKDWPRAELERCWADLARSDAAAAYRAMWNLTRHPRQSLPLLRDRLHPLTAAKPEQIAALLADLDSDTFAKRKKATTELEKLVEVAGMALRKALADKPSLEKRRRIEQILGDSQHPPPQVLRALRAVEVLEHVGTPEARQLLQRIGEGTSEALRTREAKASLERLNRSSTAKP